LNKPISSGKIKTLQTTILVVAGKMLQRITAGADQNRAQQTSYTTQDPSGVQLFLVHCYALFISSWSLAGLLIPEFTRV
jgi:hypothetical protein